MIAYTIISLILLVILCGVYYLLKPKTYDLNTTYEMYLISTSNPKIAFTKEQVGDKYKNYYFDVTEEGVIKLNPSLDDTPVNGDGTRFIFNDHGTIYDVDDKGFYISGIETKITCPENWNWDDVKKICTLQPPCAPDEVGVFKGLTKYQYDNLSKEVKDEAYHARLYMHCIQPNESEIKTCTGDTVYNGIAIQPDTVNPCVDFDICEEYPQFTKHTQNINDYVLKENEYYMCISGKSVLYGCENEEIFNENTLICEEVNVCTDQPDGTTIINGSNTYIYCYDETPKLITCEENIFISPEGVCSCPINLDETYLEFHTNSIANYPIKLVQYNYTTNIKTIREVPDTTFIMSIPLLPLTSTSCLKFERNTDLFVPQIFKSDYVDYTSADPTNITYTTYITGPITKTSIRPYIVNRHISASYHSTCTSTFLWDVIEEEPYADEEFEYYKKDNDVYKKSSKTKIGETINFIPFISSMVLYDVGTLVGLRDDELGWSIIYTATFDTLDYSGVPVDYILAAYKTATTTVFLYLNHLTFEFQIIEFSNTIVLTGDYCIFDNVNFTVTSTYFSIPPLETQLDKSETQFSSILWFNAMDSTDAIIRPHLLLPLMFEDYKQLNNKFNILYTYNISNRNYIQIYNDFLDLYTPSTTFNGDSTLLYNISSSLKALYIKQNGNT